MLSHKSFRHVLCTGLLSTTALLAVTTGVTFAAETQASTTSDKDSAGAGFAFEEVLVTARRRVESIQSVPVAVTALTEETLTRRSITDIGDLTGLAPNLTIGRNNQFSGAAQISLRGMTNMEVERSFDPSVGVAVDGVFIPTNLNQMFDLFDTQRIEVLRGPQGTLFGRNTIGGVINVIRKQPEFKFDAQAEMTVGNYGLVKINGATNLPLVKDKLALRLAVAENKFDGYFFNLYDGSRRGGDNSQQVRAALLFDASENLSFLVNYDYSRGRSPSGIALNLTSNPNDYLCLFGAPCNGVPKDLYVTNENIASLNKHDTHNVSLEINATIGQFKLTSLTAYRHHSENVNIDWDGSSISFYHSYRPQVEKSGSQELRLQSNLDGPFNFVLGGYYYAMRYDLRMRNALAFWAGCGDPNGICWGQDTSQKTESFAGFGQGDYKITDRLRLTIGGRLTHEKKTLVLMNPFQPDFVIGTPAFMHVEGLSKSFSRFTPRLGLDYHINDDMMVYASYSTGFKSGGYNGRAGTATSAAIPFDPEKVTNYEIGFKGDVIHNKLRLNLAAFDAEYSDMQVENIRAIIVAGQPNSETLISNVGKSRIRGLEAEVTAQPFNNFTLQGSGSYMDAKYTDFFADLTGTGAKDYSYLKMRRVPKYQFTASATYDVDLSNLGSLAFNAAYRWEDKQQTTVLNFPVSERSANGILDGSVTYYAPDGRLEIQAYGRNLTNKKMLDFVFVAAGLFDFGGPIPPRTYGLRVKFNM